MGFHCSYWSYSNTDQCQFYGYSGPTIVVRWWDQVAVASAIPKGVSCTLIHNNAAAICGKKIVLSSLIYRFQFHRNSMSWVSLVPVSIWCRNCRSMFRNAWIFDCVPFEILNRRLRFCIGCPLLHFNRFRFSPFACSRRCFSLILIRFVLLRGFVLFCVASVFLVRVYVCVVSPCHVMIVVYSCVFLHVICVWLSLLLICTRATTVGDHDQPLLFIVCHHWPC